MIGTASTLVMLGLVYGCRRAESHQKLSATMVVSADTAGWITPCGCTSNQSGGMLRRASYLSALADRNPLVYLDAGGAVLGNSPYAKLKFETILRGEMVMHLAAHNVGQSEAALGAAYLRDVSRRMNAPLISANVRDADGALVADPLRIVSLAHTRLAVVGVMSPDLASAAIQVDDPKQSVLAAIASVRGKFDAVVVLAYMSQDQLEHLAAALPEVDAVIGGPTGQPVPPHRVGPVLVTSSTSKGKFLDQIDFESPGSSRNWQAQLVEMNDRFQDDPRLVSVLHDYLAELKKLDMTAEQSGLAASIPPGAPQTYRVAANAACTSCHSAESLQHAGTAHGHAWQTIQSKGFDADPFCRKCHTTSYGLPGGFDSFSKTPALISVGCESCHGPSLAHTRDPKTHTPYRAADQCTHCHDHENSPKFESAAYWEKIRHGKTSAKQHEASALPAGG